MTFVLISSAVLLVSIAGIAGLFVYKTIRPGATSGDFGEGNVGLDVSDSVKQIIRRLFVRVHGKRRHAYRTAHYAHRACRFVARAAMNKYAAFDAHVNGRGDVGKRGAASFFLKSVAEHKKKFQNKK